MSRAVDLDAIAAEAKGEPIPVTLGGKKWLVRPEMPWQAARAYYAGRLDECVRLCAADGSDADAWVEAFLADGPTGKRIVDRLNAIYPGDDVGEAPAS